MADETHDTPPMSDERLAEIRANQIYYHSYMNGPTSGECAEMYGPDVDDLLAEVDRLRARESLLREILDAASAVDGAAMRGMVNHARALLAQE